MAFPSSSNSATNSPLLHASISRGSCVLAEHTVATSPSPSPSTTHIQFHGPALSALAQSLLDKLDTSRAHKRTLTTNGDGYAVHYSVDAVGLVYLCVTADVRDSQEIAYGFLREVQRRFEREYGDRALTALPYGMNEFGRGALSNLMAQFAEEPSRGQQQQRDPLGRVQGELDLVKDVMVQNIEKVLDRGERMEVLVDKTDSLNQAALQFKKRSTALKRRMWWKNIKLNLIIALVLALAVYLLVGAGCGLPAWDKCVGNK